MSLDRDRRTCVVAVIVTFHPDVAVLASLLEIVAVEVSHVLVVVNDGASSCPLPNNATLHKPKKNVGLGAAYNFAAGWAEKRGASHLLLLDQDSLPEVGVISALLKVVTERQDVAAAGPLWRDSRTGADGFFVRLSGWGAHKYTPAADEVVSVDFLISSGSLIPLDALEDIGPFDEKLFIDHVDTDWSLRARAKGYQLYGVAGARIDQQFGEQTLAPSILGIRRRLFLYPPQRNYYLLRNSMILWRRPYAPWRWIAHDIRRTFLLMVFYALFVPPRWERVKWMWQAIRDSCRQG